MNMKPQQFSTNIIQQNDGNKALNEPSNKLYGYLKDFDVQRLKSSLSASYSQKKQKVRQKNQNVMIYTNG